MFYECPNCRIVRKVQSRPQIPTQCIACGELVRDHNPRMTIYCRVCRKHVWNGRDHMRLHDWRNKIKE